MLMKDLLQLDENLSQTYYINDLAYAWISSKINLDLGRGLITPN
jgi:hypothetical protein